MATIRNTTKSRRYIEDGGRRWELLFRKDVHVPDDVIARYKARGPGIRRLFDAGILVVKGAGRVVRMESAQTNERPEVASPVAGGDEGGDEAKASSGGQRKKRTRKKKTDG